MLLLPVDMINYKVTYRQDPDIGEAFSPSGEK